MTGKFITFEGGEGSGKSTQTKLLDSALQKASICTTLTREPGGTKEAEAIRKILVEGEPGSLDPITETYLFNAARRHHVLNLIRPALEEGDWVISDRFYTSTIVYQGFGHGVSLDVLEALNEMTVEQTKPDIIFLLDIDVEAGLKRAVGRGEAEQRFEKMDQTFHRHVREGFLKIAKMDPDKYKVIDASATLEDIHHQIIDELNSRFDLGLKYEI